MKYVLICVIVAAGALLGSTFTSMEKKRLVILTSLITAAGRVNGSMAKQGCMLSHALMESELEEKGIFYMSGEMLSDEKDDLNVKTLANKSGVDRDICAAVISYIEALSSSTLACQIESYTQAFLEEIERKLKDTREVRLKKAATARNLCLFAAIALGIILI